MNESVVLIDINPDSVAGACAHFKSKSVPELFYTKRIAVTHGVEHALQLLTDHLLTEGSPALAHATGSGRISEIVVSIGGTFVETAERTITIDIHKPFIFTKELLDSELHNTEAISDDRILLKEVVLSIALNGYRTDQPFGKLVNRVEVVVLTSTIDGRLAEIVTRIVSGAYHTRALRLVATPQVTHTVLREMFPYEKDYAALSTFSFLPGHFAARVKTRGDSEGDAALAMLVIYFAHAKNTQ